MADLLYPPTVAPSALPMTPAPSAQGARPSAPRSPTDLFWSFTWLALQGFGGVLAIVQRELVEKKRWLTREEFIEDWAVAQILPGPNVVNLALMIGSRHFGLKGGLAALAGMLCLPTVVVVALAVGYASVASHPAALGALRGMGAVAGGLIFATALKLLPSLASNPMGRSVCWLVGGTTMLAVAWARWPLAVVLAAVGSVACGWAWHCLRPRAAPHDTNGGTP
jgi:chromate transporter